MEWLLIPATLPPLIFGLCQCSPFKLIYAELELPVVCRFRLGRLRFMDRPGGSNTFHPLSTILRVSGSRCQSPGCVQSLFPQIFCNVSSSNKWLPHLRSHWHDHGCEPFFSWFIKDSIGVETNFAYILWQCRPSVRTPIYEGPNLRSRLYIIDIWRLGNPPSTGRLLTENRSHTVEKGSWLTCQGVLW